MKNPRLLIGILSGAALLSACTENIPMAAESLPVTVPIRIVKSRPLIEIRINGMPVTVLFDLGGSENLSIFPSVLDEIEKTQVGESTDLVSLYGPEDGKPIYQVDLVEIGNLSFTNIDVVEDFHDADYQADFAANTGAYGAIGPGLFHGHKLVLDYQRKEMTIIGPDVPETQQSSCRGREIPLMPGSDGGVLTMAKTEIGDVRFVWDTGAVPNIILKNFADSKNLDVSDNNEVMLNQVIFGEHEFGPMNFKVWDFPVTPPFDGFFGHEYFKNNIVCVDLPGHRLLIRE